MTSHQAQLQVLITEIESLLSKAIPKLPWVMAGETNQQRRVLEQALGYLNELKSLRTLSEGLAEAPAAPLSARSAASGEAATAEVSGQQVLQALLQEIQFLRSQTIQPLTAEIVTLRQQSDALKADIRRLELERAGLVAGTESTRQLDPAWVSEIVEQLRCSLMEQLSPEIRALRTQLGGMPTLAPSPRDPQERSADLPQLLPQERLEQLRQIQAQTDYLLLKLDSNLRAVFESLEQSIQSYCDSLSQGLDDMHGLGQQGEVIFRAFVNHLAQQLGQESSYLPTSDDSAARLLGAEGEFALDYPDYSSTEEEFLAPSDSTETAINFDDIDLDANIQEGEEITLFQLDEEITQLQLVEEDDIDDSLADDTEFADQPVTANQDDENTLIQAGPIPWQRGGDRLISEAEGVSPQSGESTRDDMPPDEPPEYTEDIAALYENLFGDSPGDLPDSPALEPGAIEPRSRRHGKVPGSRQSAGETLDEPLLGLTLDSDGPKESPETLDDLQSGLFSGEPLEPNQENRLTDEEISQDLPMAAESSLEGLFDYPAPLTDEAELRSMADFAEVDGPAATQAASGDDAAGVADEAAEQSLENFLGSALATELRSTRTDASSARDRDTISSLSDLFPDTDTAGGAEVLSNQSPLSGEDETTFVAASPDENLLTSEVDDAAREIELSLDEAALTRLAEDLSSLEAEASESLSHGSSQTAAQLQESSGEAAESAPLEANEPTFSLEGISLNLELSDSDGEGFDPETAVSDIPAEATAEITSEPEIPEPTGIFELLLDEDNLPDLERPAVPEKKETLDLTAGEAFFDDGTTDYLAARQPSAASPLEALDDWTIEQALSPVSSEDPDVSQSPDDSWPFSLGEVALNLDLTDESIGTSDSWVLDTSVDTFSLGGPPSIAADDAPFSIEADLEFADVHLPGEFDEPEIADATDASAAEEDSQEPLFLADVDLDLDLSLDTDPATDGATPLTDHEEEPDASDGALTIDPEAVNPANAVSQAADSSSLAFAGSYSEGFSLTLEQADVEDVVERAIADLDTASDMPNTSSQSGTASPLEADKDPDSPAAGPENEAHWLPLGSVSVTEEGANDEVSLTSSPFGETDDPITVEVPDYSSVLESAESEEAPSRREEASSEPASISSDLLTEAEIAELFPPAFMAPEPEGTDTTAATAALFPPSFAAAQSPESSDDVDDVADLFPPSFTTAETPSQSPAASTDRTEDLFPASFATDDETPSVADRDVADLFPPSFTTAETPSQPPAANNDRTEDLFPASFAETVDPLPGVSAASVDLSGLDALFGGTDEANLEASLSRNELSEMSGNSIDGDRSLLEELAQSTPVARQPEPEPSNREPDLREDEQAVLEETAAPATAQTETSSVNQLLAIDVPSEADAGKVEAPPLATPIPGEEWFLGLDVGTGGLSAVLMERTSGAAHPLYWATTARAANGATTFRLPAVATVPQETLSTEGGNPADGLRLTALKPLMRVGVPHHTAAGSWEPVIQWSTSQQVSLNQVLASTQHLIARIGPIHSGAGELGAVGLEAPQINRILGILQGVVLGSPSSWSDTYRLNLREAVLAAGLVQDPSQIFFVEEAIAAILSGLPDPSDPLPPQNPQIQTLYQCAWTAGTVVISAGASCTDFGIVQLPQLLDTLSREDFALRNFAYGGDALDLDIISQLLLPPERRKPRTGQEQSQSLESSTGWSPSLPVDTSVRWESLKLDSLDLPQLAEPDENIRIRMRQQLEDSSLGQGLLEAAKYLKHVLQGQGQFTLTLADQSWRVLRRELENRVLVPYIQRLNQHLNALLSQTDMSPHSIKQVICTGGNVSFATVAKWLRQKFPNAIIVQDTYPSNRPPSCSRVAYGLVNLCRYPQVLEGARHQFSDYFLLNELVRIFPDQPMPLNGILHLLEEQGIPVEACEARILALLEGHLPAGLVPDTIARAYLTQETLNNGLYQSLAAGTLFTKQSRQIYVLDSRYRDLIRRQLAMLFTDKRQRLRTPLIAQLVTP